MYGAHESREDPLGFQQRWTSYFCGPEILSIACFPLKGLSHPPQESHVAFSSLAQDWASTQDQQEVEEGEEEGSLGVWTYWLLGG